jgi:hypothetical protein
MNKLIEILNHYATARDGISYSLTKAAGMCGVGAVTYNFVRSGSADYQGYGLAISGLMVALAIKYAVEDKE